MHGLLSTSVIRLRSRAVSQGGMLAQVRLPRVPRSSWPRPERRARVARCAAPSGRVRVRAAGVFLVGAGLCVWSAAAAATESPLERIDVSTSGEPASAAGLVPSLSADGRFVVFESSANNLVSGDTNGRVDPRDVF